MSGTVLAPGLRAVVAAGVAALAVLAAGCTQHKDRGPVAVELTPETAAEGWAVAGTRFDEQPHTLIVLLSSQAARADWTRFRCLLYDREDRPISDRYEFSVPPVAAGPVVPYRMENLPVAAEQLGRVVLSRADD